MSLSDVLTASEARRSLFPLIDQLNRDGGTIRVTSKAGDIVVMSADEYSALEETAHLLRSPANAERLLRSIGKVRLRQSRQLDEA